MSRGNLSRCFSRGYTQLIPFVIILPVCSEKERHPRSNFGDFQSPIKTSILDGQKYSKNGPNVEKKGNNRD